MTPYYADDGVTLYHGDALNVLREMPDGSVNSCVTSPPYFGLRDYGEEGQYGLESSPAEYVETMRTLFAEVRRVLADDGTLWLNLGDSYSGSWGNQSRNETSPGLAPATDGRFPAQTRTGAIRPGQPPAKNLLMIPETVALALRGDGWILRNKIVWNKPNAMPSSVLDRLNTTYEHVFLFSKSRRYWFDLDPIREPVIYPAGSPALNWARDTKEAEVPGQSTRQHRSSRGPKYPVGTTATYRPGDGRQHLGGHEQGRNPGDVWVIPTKPFTEAHFAVMPPELAERCILAGCKPGGTVLDPFSGSGTTGMVAQRHGRKYVGIDLNAGYLDLSLRTRLQQAALDFGEVS